MINIISNFKETALTLKYWRLPSNFMIVVEINVLHKEERSLKIVFKQCKLRFIFLIIFMPLEIAIIKKNLVMLLFLFF